MSVPIVIDESDPDNDIDGLVYEVEFDMSVGSGQPKRACMAPRHDLY